MTRARGKRQRKTTDDLDALTLRLIDWTDARLPTCPHGNVTRECGSWTTCN